MNRFFHGDSAAVRPNDGFFGVVNRLLVVGIVAILAVGCILAFIPLLRQRHRETAQIEQLQTEVSRKKTAVAQLRREAELLKNDPAYIELKARDRLDMMKPGETIVRFEPGQPPVSPARPVR